MNNDRNQRIYHRWAPVYDFFFRPMYDRARKRAIELLALRPGERLLIPGVGAGLDLPLLPPEISVIGVALSASMLKRAHAKVGGRDVELLAMDAQQLEFPDANFDAVLLTLIVSVVPDGATAFQEAWRVLCPGGRVVIFDKFLPEDGHLTPARRLVGRVASAVGTDPNRRLSEVIGGVLDIAVERNEPSLLRGQYRHIVLRKANTLRARAAGYLAANAATTYPMRGFES